MDSEKQKYQKPSFIISIRFFMAILGFFGYALQYAQKTNMSVAIVCMVNNTAVLLEQQQSKIGNNAFESNLTNYENNQTFTSNADLCPAKASSGNSSADGEFVYTKAMQGYILSAYFYGYSCANLPGGLLSMRFGGKWVNFVAIFVGSIATLLTPVSAYLNFWALFASRFLAGIVHGVMWPAFSSMWAHWAVPEERSRLVSISNAGAQIGNVIALPLGSFLCTYGFAGGWPSIFYVFGIAGLIWSVVWAIFTANNPSEHKFISEKEREFIKNGTNVAPYTGTPWKAIMTNKACIALFVGHTTSNWGTYLFLTNIPTYMKEVLKFDIKSNGTLSALPYIVFWAVIIISGIASDKILAVKPGVDTTDPEVKEKLANKRKNVRRIFNGIGYLTPMTAVIGLSFVTCQHPYVGVALLVLGVATIGCQYGGGFLVNYNDVCGRYSGMTLGIANTFASVPGVLAPFFVSFITKNQLQSEWRIVFLVTAGVYLIGAIVLFIFAEAKTQPFALAKPDASKDAKHEEELKKLYQK